MNKKEKATSFPRLRFPQFQNYGAINFKNGNHIFEPISDRNHNSDLPVLAITQEHGAIPRELIDYNVTVTDKSIESYKVVQKGDFIISLRSFQGGIEYSMFRGICSPAYIILRKKMPINELYYKYYFKTGKFIQELNKNIEGIRDGKMVSYSQFSSLLLPMPDIKEQQKIADCLSSLDDLITAEDKKLEALKKHKKGLMQKLFPAEGETVPEWRFPEFRGSGEWEKKTLGQLGELVSGLTYSPDDIRESGLLVLRSSNIKNNRICLEDNVYVRADIKGANLSLPNDILICVRNGSKTLIGKNAIIPENMPLCTHGAFMTVFRTKKAKFVFQLLQTDAYEKQVKADLGATINSINGTKLKKYVFYLPKDPKEQQKIADFLSCLDTLITAQAEKIEFLRDHKKGLMQDLFPSIRR
ncbi:restriction endonuclease subunit S [Brevibacillus agri]|uniref:restriction endonuclease subunit S n=1 Tax=Brevibacillus agri TaxID=51101 RepID=UPI0024C0C50E|nr:restriction endonuclease subunit S [Brevibacillus agri]WHX32043.1 restriction endonuclease subunit S [Brevibacillus agri]